MQDAASSALSAFPSADIDGGGTLWLNGKEAARYDADMTKWQKRRKWQDYSNDQCIAWEDWVKKARAGKVQMPP